MRSFVNAALICAATLGSISVAEAMPAAPAAAISTVGEAQVEKVVMIVRKTVIMRRPRMMMMRRPRIMKRVIIRR